MRRVVSANDVVGGFYEAAANPDLWSEALGSASELFGCRGALLTTPTFQPGGIPHSPGLADAVEQFFSEAWHLDDERSTAVRAKGWRAGFFTDYDLFSDKQMMASRYYNEFAKNAGVPWFCAGILTGSAQGEYVSISFQRSRAQGNFEPGEIQKLNSLLPHLQNAASLAERLVKARGHSLVDGLDIRGEPALLLSANGSVAYAGTAAEKLLGDGLSIRNGRLCADRATENSMLTACVATACKSGRGAVMLPAQVIAVSSRSGQAPLLVRVAPIMRSASDVFGFTGAIVMLTDLNAALEVPQQALRALFGLTRRETEVMRLIANGRTPAEAAEVMSVSVETVRSQLKAVLSKTQTHRQSELAALYARICIAGDRGKKFDV